MTGLDPRVAAGMRDQLRLRDETVAAGARLVGWKLGFGSPAAMASLGLDRPLVGFLVDTRVVEDGATVAVESWTRPLLEAEVAVHLAADVPGDATRDDVLAAVAGISTAIELADLSPPPDDVRTILAGDVFHRHVVLGPVDRRRRTGDGLTAHVDIDGEQVAATADPAELTGELLELVRLTAATLDACGERLRAGEVVITGAVVPPIPVRAGQRVAVTVDPLGTLRLSLA